MQAAEEEGSSRPSTAGSSRVRSTKRTEANLWYDVVCPRSVTKLVLYVLEFRLSGRVTFALSCALLLQCQSVSR